MDRSGNKLGTFLGVFTPSILTILGVVLFLRTGWLVGSVGLLRALAIVVAAHALTLATALSVAAIATNMRVGAGGAYYIVSRLLGLEIGGAIGIPLFLAQTFSVTLYAFGLAESLQRLWPWLPQQPVAGATVLLVAALSVRGAALALRWQLPIMAAIGVALLSLAAGALSSTQESLPLLAAAPAGAGFWRAFAVFFPAVTGILAGVSLSGDLRDPSRGIVRGTLAAVGVGFAVYVAVSVMLALAAPPERLVRDHLIWFRVAAVPLLVYPGLFGAIFSSAVGSMLAAPRTLAALGRDGVLPRLPRRLFGRSIGDTLPLLASAAVALAAVQLGNLDAVAPVLTMFFLTTYAVVNLAAGLEQLSGSPSYRPVLRVPSLVSLAGALGCLWVMWLISPLAAIVAVAIEVLVYAGLRRRSLNAAWGDLRHGAILSLVRACLLALRRMPHDPRNWRPHILVLADDPRRRLELIRFADWLNQRRGIVTVARLLEGSVEERHADVEPSTQEIDQVLDAEGIVAFAETDIVECFEQGVVDVCQANGIAGLASNTVMIGWPKRRERMIEVLRALRRAALLGKSTVLCRLTGRPWGATARRIDVWWGGLQHNGDMLLLLAHLLSLNPEWRRATVTVKSVASNPMTLDSTRRRLADLITRNRIQAVTDVIELREGETVQRVIHRESADADLVLMGFAACDPGQEEALAERLESLLGPLPSVLFVRAAGPFAGRLLESEPAR